MVQFLDSFRALQEGEYTNEQEQAGVRRLERFGPFNTYVELAKMGVLGSTIDQVLEQETRVVYTLLLREKEKNDYEQAYLKIIRK